MALQKFKAESKRLLDLMINSIYTHKEIFLRELISNASDAIDKRYFHSLSDGITGMSKDDYFIEIKPDKETRTLTISDNGCGMTKDELIKNLGTIADSGTFKFKQEHKMDDSDSEIIGQFGVGFYSAFMVSKKVTVISKSVLSEAESWKWESEGVDGFRVDPYEKSSIGTDIILTLKDNTTDEQYDEFLEQYRIKGLVQKYSSYIRYPIRMEMEKSRKKEDSDDYETYHETETLNSMTPIWKRPKSEIKKDEYDSFYMDKFMDYETPMHIIHTSAEGAVSYNALLFIPSHAPFDYYSKSYEKGLQLYSNGVMIMDKCADLLPDYFSFVKGLIDSPDLSLNISREMLQHDRQLKTIAVNIEKKIKSELLNLIKTDREKYESFFKEFGNQLKYGVYVDYGMHMDTLKDLLMFHSLKTDKLITLQEYVDNMKEDQKEIFYASGSSVSSIRSMPQLEQIESKEYDVLCLTEDVDEFALTMMQKYADKTFKSISSGDLNTETEEEKKAVEQQNKDNKKLLDSMKEILKDKVKDVRISSKLKKNAVCLTAEGPISIEMEKILNAMPNDSNIRADRILELNADHPVFQKLSRLSDEKKADELEKLTGILYTQAQLIEGILPDNPTEYAEAILSMIS